MIELIASHYISDHCSCNTIALTVLVTVVVIASVVVIQFPYVNNNSASITNSTSEMNRQEKLINDLMDEVRELRAELDGICNCSSAVLTESVEQNFLYDYATPSPVGDIILSPNNPSYPPQEPSAPSIVSPTSPPSTEHSHPD